MPHDVLAKISNRIINEAGNGGNFAILYSECLHFGDERSNNFIKFSSWDNSMHKRLTHVNWILYSLTSSFFCTAHQTADHLDCKRIGACMQNERIRTPLSATFHGSEVKTPLRLTRNLVFLQDHAIHF